MYRVRPLLYLLLGWLPAQAAAGTPPAPSTAAVVTPPTLAPGSVLHPRFSMNDGKSYDTGTAFATEFSAETILLTAHHNLGPMGGLPAQLTADEVPTAVKSVRFVDAWSRDRIGSDATAVRVPGAHPMADDAVGDLAVFRLPTSFDRISAGNNLPFHALPLATADAKLGDPVWLAAAVVGTEAHLFPAHVVEIKPTFLFYEFDSVVDLRGTPGAPVLNALGEVVGINLGGGIDQGKTIGAAGPVSGIRARLLETLKP